MKILIADDHDLLREALESLLESEGDFDVSLAADVDGAVAAIQAEGPFNVILLDFTMPGMNGLAGPERIISIAPKQPVAIMSGNAPQGVAERALELGAAGFIPKTLAARSMVNALRFIASGERFVPMEILQGSRQSADEGPYQKLLTQREQQVLTQLCESLSNKEIARQLDLREPTVKLHVKLLCRKLGARNRTHAAMLAKCAGFC